MVCMSLSVMSLISLRLRCTWSDMSCDSEIRDYVNCMRVRVGRVFFAFSSYQSEYVGADKTRQLFLFEGFTAEEHAVCLLFQGRLCWAMTLETIIPTSVYKRRHERRRKFVKRSLNIDG